MDATDPILTDPVQLVRQLDATVIRERIDQLDREREALLVLLRSALRTQREQQKQRKKEAR